MRPFGFFFDKIDSEFWGMTYFTRVDSRKHDLARARREARARK